MTNVPLRKSQMAPLPNSGPFLAKIVSHLDPTNNGTLEVQLLHAVGNDPDREGQLHQVRYLSPFFGSTSVDHVVEEPNDYNNTQKSYGMWFVPPDVGNIVVVIFIEGDPAKGYWIGCAHDENMNFQVPGLAATQYVLEDTKVTDKERVPVAEYNKKATQVWSEANHMLKPAHPLEGIFENQGLLEDDIRGITTSSARREVPSSVFGISTPGPVDKRSGAKRGKIGKHEHKIPNAFVSRLGGSTFVMDDGDDKFIRKKSPSEGPPDYAAVEQSEEGLVTIPHNELIRFRTRTGHQILMHNSEDLIYIGNARGTSWIEMTSDGKIEIYAEDSISFRTKKDFNFYADRDINLEAARNINIRAKNEMHTHVTEAKLVVDANHMIKVSGNVDSITGGSHKQTSGTNEWLGNNLADTPWAPGAGAASPAPVLKTHQHVDEKGQIFTSSIVRRIPTHEPYPHHENLDPEKSKSGNIDRDVEGRYGGNTSTFGTPTEYWKKYTTKVDTFDKKASAQREDQSNP